MSLGPQAGLARSLTRSFSALLAAQARALIVERQPLADPGDDDLLAAASEAQRVLGEQATDLLSNGVRSVILGALTPADRIINLARAVEASLPGGATPADAMEVAQYLHALAEAAVGVRDKTLSAAADHDAWVARVDAATETLAKSVRSVIETLKAQEGVIELLEARIEAKRKNIDDTVDEILDDAENIGDKIKDIAAEAIAFLKPDGKKRKSKPRKGGDGDDPKEEPKTRKPAAAEPKPGATASADERRADKTAAKNTRLAGDPAIWEDADEDDLDDPDDHDDGEDGDDDAFDETRAREIGARTVEALNGAGDAARKMGTASARLTALNRELAELYYQLAGVRGSIAWARAIGDQGRSLRRAADQMGDALGDTADYWDALIQDLRRQASDLEDSGDLAAVRERWARRDREAWSDLADRLAAIRSAVAGRTRLIAL